MHYYTPEKKIPLAQWIRCLTIKLEAMGLNLFWTMAYFFVSTGMSVDLGFGGIVSNQDTLLVLHSFEQELSEKGVYVC